MKYKFMIFLILITGINLIGFTQNGSRNVKITVGQSFYKLPESNKINGCAGWNSDQFNQYDVIRKTMPNTTFSGRFNGGEIGRFVNNGRNQAGMDLLSVLLLYNTK